MNPEPWWRDGLVWSYVLAVACSLVVGYALAMVVN